MIEEYYVKFTTALILHEIGCLECQNTMAMYVTTDEAVMQYYNHYTCKMEQITLKKGDLLDPNDRLLPCYEIIEGRVINAPTHQMALAWLREECGLMIKINSHIDAEDKVLELTHIEYSASYYLINQNARRLYKGAYIKPRTYKRYEEAEENAILEMASLIYKTVS